MRQSNYSRMKKVPALSRFKITLIILSVIIVITGCSSGYREKNGRVTFNGEEIADKNFVVLNESFGKSDSTAYYKRYALAGVDLASFSGLDKHYAKDKSTVYYCDEERVGQNYFLTKLAGIPDGGF